MPSLLHLPSDTLYNNKKDNCHALFIPFHIGRITPMTTPPASNACKQGA